MTTEEKQMLSLAADTLDIIRWGLAIAISRDDPESAGKHIQGLIAVQKEIRKLSQS